MGGGAHPQHPRTALRCPPSASRPVPRVCSPDRLNPDWCRLRTGVMKILLEQDARDWVPLPGLAGSITSWTGPS